MRTLSSLIVALTLSLTAGIASAATYKITNDSANNSPLAGSGISIASWIATLTTSSVAGESSTFSGSGVGTDGKNYQIDVTLLDTYFQGATQRWKNFKGSITGNGRNISLNDIDPGQDGMDAVLGINGTPYNNAFAGGNDQLLEFGFWSDDSAAQGGVRNGDINVHVTCISASGAPGKANPDGTCSTTTGSSSGSSSSSTSSSGASGGSSSGGPRPVPLPGTLALVGLALLGLGAVRKIK
jgi:uncharacterized membrane protein YgcG